MKKMHSLRTSPPLLARRPWQALLALLFFLIPLGTPGTYAQSGTVTYDTVTQFNSNAACAAATTPTFTGTALSEDSNGELRLTPQVQEPFDSLTSAWQALSYDYTPAIAGAPTFIATGGTLAIRTDAATGRGGYVQSTANVSNYGDFEAVVSFDGGRFQRIGLSTGGSDPAVYAMFVSDEVAGNRELFALVRESGGINDATVPSFLLPQNNVRVRIRWSQASATADQFDLYIFRASAWELILSEQVPAAELTGGLGIRVSNRSTSLTPTLPLDGTYLNTAITTNWLRYTAADGAALVTPAPTPASGTYESCPIQINTSLQKWGAISWVATTPTDNPFGGTATTSVGLEMRAADTLGALAGAAYIPVTSGSVPALPARQFAQFRATLNTDDNSVSPTLDSLTLGYVTFVPGVTPASDNLGTQFRVQGTGFSASTALSVTLDGTPIGSGLTSNTFGEFTFYLNSTDAVVGSHTVVVSGAGQSPLSYPFSVTAGGAAAATPPPPPGTTPPTYNMPAPAECSDGVAPSYVIAGNSITLTACDFARSATLTSTLNSVANSFAPSVNANGALNTTFDTTGLAAGNYTLVLSGTHFSGSGTETATFNFRIARANAVTPSSARDGTFFLVEGRGLANNTALTVTLDGSPVTVTPSLSSDSVGEFAFYLDSTNATSGSHSVTISDGSTSVGPLAFTVDVGGTLGVTTGSPVGTMPAPTCSIGTLQFNPSFASAGTAVQVQACGFGRNASIAIRVDGNLIAQTTTANANGAVNFNLDTTGFTPGARSIELRGNTFPRSVTQLNRTASLTITQPAVMDPTSGRYDTLFRARGDGFNASTNLTLELDGVSIGNVNTDGTGQYDLYLDSTLAETGSHTLVVRGNIGASTGAETFNFTVTGTGTPVTPNPGAVAVFDMPAPSCVVGGSVSPTTGTEATSFTMTGCGFGRNATLNVSIDGSAVGTVNADVNGRFSYPINIDALAEGTHSVAVSGSPFSGATPRTVTGSFTLDLTSFEVYLPLVLAP